MQIIDLSGFTCKINKLWATIKALILRIEALEGLSFTPTVVIESSIDMFITTTGTLEPTFGLTDGSYIITNNAFKDKRVLVFRGSVLLPGQDPLDGNSYGTKVLANNFITLLSPLSLGEFIRIQTIN